jgi:hypothetical protein
MGGLSDQRREIPGKSMISFVKGKMPLVGSRTKLTNWNYEGYESKTSQKSS